MELDREQLPETVLTYRPVAWEMIPDLGLYMDQVITFITRMYEPLYGPATDGYLSSSMINNYVKSKLIPRPTGKKYSREQIALLCMIVALKQVSTMEDIRIMLSPDNGLTTEQMYIQFCACHQSAISALARNEDQANFDLPPAMTFAIISSGYRAGCEALLRTQTRPTAEAKE